MSLACSCRELERKAAALVKLALLKISGHVVVLPEKIPSPLSTLRISEQSRILG